MKVMRFIRSVSGTAIIIAMVAALLMYGVTYHGNTVCKDNKDAGHVDTAQVVREAKMLTGLMYDMTGGRFGNALGRRGFIVCIDIPVLAYQNSGYSIKEAMAKDFARRPGSYDTREGNNPGSQFFHRRARNLYVYCKNNGRLIPPALRPAPGDVVFYKWDERAKSPLHVALVTEVGGDGGYKVVESSLETVFSRELDQRWVTARGYIPMGFGRLAGKG